MGDFPDEGSLGQASLVRGHYAHERSFIDIYLRDDAKTVSIIALGCFHPNVKVQSASLHFFQGNQEEQDSSDEGDDVR